MATGHGCPFGLFLSDSVVATTSAAPRSQEATPALNLEELGWC